MFTDEGVFKMLAESMETHKDDYSVQYASCVTVSALVSGHAVFAEPSPEIAHQAASAGVIPKIVRALKTFSKVHYLILAHRETARTPTHPRMGSTIFCAMRFHTCSFLWF